MNRASEHSKVEDRVVRKRSPAKETFASNQPKRRKYAAGTAAGITNKSLQANKGQRSLEGFFRPKQNKDERMGDAEGFKEDSRPASLDISESDSQTASMSEELQDLTSLARSHMGASSMRERSAAESSAEIGVSETHASATILGDETVVDPIVSKESWSRLFSKRAPPKCEGHQEPCISLITKKPGINCGRAFWMCPRPLGPSGDKEKGTQWRCSTFIWASDWNAPS